MKEIYTHDLATQVIECFEDLLEEQNVTLESPEDNDRDENSGRIYGSTYSDLMDAVEDVIIGVLKKHDVPFIEDVYSGTI